MPIASATAAKDWTSLLESGVRRALSYNQALPEEWKRIVDVELEASKSYGASLPAVASKVVDALGGRSGPKFAGWMRAEFADLTVDRPELIEAIGSLGLPILTTNFDHLLEKQLGRETATWRSPSHMQMVLQGKSKDVGHLHGSWRELDSVILGEQSYGHIIGDPGARAIQEALTSARTVVFVGCGAGISDPNFSALRDWMRSIWSGSESRHYRLCREQEVQDLTSEHATDDEDVMLLTLVRVGFPALFNDLPKYRTELISGHTDELKRGASAIECLPFTPEVLLTRVPVRSHETARKLLGSLFPELKWEETDALEIPYASRTRRGVATDGYFDRYFAMGIPSHDVPDSVVREAVRTARAGDANPLVALLTQPDEEQIQVAIIKATDPDNQPTTTAETLELARSLTKAANQLPKASLSSFGALSQTLTWIGALLGSAAGHADSAQLKDVLQDLNSVSLSVRTMNAMDEQARRNRHADATIVVAEVGDWLGDQAAEGFLAHLAAGDGAPSDFPQATLRQFAVRRGKQAALKEGIENVLQSNGLDISHLASRFVTAHGSTAFGGLWTLSDEVDQASFELLAPAGDAPWFHEERLDGVDYHDLSWANRRRFAVGRFQPPAAATTPPELQTPGPSDDGGAGGAS